MDGWNDSFRATGFGRVFDSCATGQYATLVRSISQVQGARAWGLGQVRGRLIREGV